MQRKKESGRSTKSKSNVDWEKVQKTQRDQSWESWRLLRIHRILRILRIQGNSELSQITSLHRIQEYKETRKIWQPECGAREWVYKWEMTSSRWGVCSGQVCGLNRCGDWTGAWREQWKLLPNPGDWQADCDTSMTVTLETYWSGRFLSFTRLFAKI